MISQVYSGEELSGVHDCNADDEELAGLLYQAILLLLAAGADPREENGIGDVALMLTDYVTLLELFGNSDEEIKRLVSELELKANESNE